MSGGGWAFESFEFTPEYEVEVRPEFPGDGDWGCPVVSFGQEGERCDPFESRWGPAVVVRISSTRGDWVGSFAAGGIGGITGVYACPSSTDLLVVSDGNAYLTDVRHPDRGAVVPQVQVSQVVPVEGRPLLLLARMTDIIAIGPGGIEWRSRRLCIDDLRIMTAHTDAITCSGYFLGDASEVEVDPTTGSRISGGTLPEGWPDE